MKKERRVKKEGKRIGRINTFTWHAKSLIHMNELVMLKTYILDNHDNYLKEKVYTQKIS